MAVAALLRLKNESALPLQRGCAVDESFRHGITAPGVHVRAPGCELCEVRKGSQSDRGEQNSQNRNRPAFPALFSFARKEGKKQQSENNNDRADDKCWCLERRGKQREQAVEPEEKVIGLGDRLDNRWIGFAGRPKWTKVKRACGHGQDDHGREEQIG